MTDSRIIEELEQMVDRLRLEREQRRVERLRGLAERVAAYLTEHPDASANVVQREVGGRRTEVQRLVRNHKQRFPFRGNQPDEGTVK